MPVQQTISIVRFFKNLSEETLSNFLKAKDLSLDAEQLLGDEGQSYWEDSVDDLKVGQ